MGLLEDKVYWSVLSTGMSALIATIISIKLVESFGRRPLILYPLAIIALCTSSNQSEYVFYEFK